ncbi:MAG: hypothetical protein U0168_13225 [Nannocystaceae bacterium]
MTSPRKPSSPRRADEPEGVEPDDALGRAPRAAAPAVPRDAPAPTRPSATTAGADLAAGLAAAFAEHVQRALGLPLDGSETSLAFVDHYLRTARDGTRGPIAALVAAEAGAYYGELVRQLLGAQWIGEGPDPRRPRSLLEHQFLHFSPIDQAHEILAGLREDDDDDDDDDDAPDPDEPPLDTAFHARSTPAATHPDAPTDASWLRRPPRRAAAGGRGRILQPDVPLRDAQARARATGDQAHVRGPQPTDIHARRLPRRARAAPLNAGTDPASGRDRGPRARVDCPA